MAGHAGTTFVTESVTTLEKLDLARILPPGPSVPNPFVTGFVTGFVTRFVTPHRGTAGTRLQLQQAELDPALSAVRV